MNLASIIVVAILLSCFFFFISLPFGVEREKQYPEQGDFSGIRKVRLWPKIGFALLMSAMMTTALYFVDGAGYFDQII